MAKLKVTIDSDIDFCIDAQVEAFGFETGFHVRRKKKVSQGKVGLSDGSIDEFASEDYSEEDSE